MGSYFYKKLWDFLTFKEFLTESLSNDELYFYLHFRNLIFEGPQLNYQSSTFEVVSYVSYENVKRLILVQFESKVEFGEDLQKLLEKLDKHVVRKNKKELIDGYFALRLILQFYIQEKKVFLDKLRRAFARVSFMGEKDLDATLNFLEFREFVNLSFEKVTQLETCQLYRLAWNLGNGTVNFSSFLTAAYELKIFIKELQMENSATLSLTHVETKISDEIKSYQISDEISEFLKPMEEMIYTLYDEGCLIGNPIHSNSCQKLIEFMNKTLGFNSREEMTYQGDKINLIVSIWISLLRSVVALRSVSLESSKFGRPVVLRKSEFLRDKILRMFHGFLKGINFKYLQRKTPSWVEKSIGGFQEEVKSQILKKAKEHFEENLKAKKEQGG